MIEKEMSMLNNVIEMEKFVLSAMQIREGECVPAVMAALEPDDFYRPQHRLVFRTSVKLYAEGTPPNVLSLVQEFQKTGDLENIGVEFLYMLTEYAHTTAYVDAYCQKIKEASNLRRVQFAAEKTAQLAAEGKLSANEIITATATEFDAITRSTNETKIISIHDFIRDEFDSAMKIKAAYAQRKSGFTNLNRAQIWTPGLFFVGGTPGSGKTTFCQQLLEGFARNGEECIYCSYEMSAEEIAMKSIARQLYLDDPYTRLYASNLHECYGANDRRQSSVNNISKIIDAREAINDMNLTNFRVIELHDENTDKLLNMINRLCKNDKAPVVCIDYLQLLAQVDGTENVKVAVDNTVRKLKVFSRDTGATIFVVSSLNRGNYTEQAGFEAFKESGGIDFGADVAWILQLFVLNEFKGGLEISAKRKKVAEAMKEFPRKIQMRCLKNRRGAMYDCYFNYYPSHDFFVDPAEDVNANPDDRWYEKARGDISSVNSHVDENYAYEEDDESYSYEEDNDDN